MKKSLYHALGTIVLCALLNGFDVHISFRPTQDPITVLARTMEL